MKKKIGNQNVLYPTPVTVAGALVNGRVNFLNIAHVGILNAKAPHLISLDGPPYPELSAFDGMQTPRHLPARNA